jgi:predicted transposase YdaD
METDKHFYEIFEVNPQWIFELTGRPSPGPCQFISMTLKAIERRTDGVLVPDSPSESISVTELQMQLDRDVYGRITMEMVLVQSERPGRKVEGIIIFGSRDLDPRTEPWHQVVSVYYLDEMIEQLSARMPNHPLIAVFQPLLEKNLELLERNAAMYYTQIKFGTSDERQKAKLLDVFIDWMLQRFSELGKEEIEIMLLGKLPDLRDTQAGKDLIAIGVEKGIEKGIEKGALIGTIRTCQSVLGLEMSSETNLSSKSNEELSKIASELQASVRNRFGLK